MISLESTQSTRVALEAIRDGKAGLNEHRQSLLDCAPNSGDWCEFEVEHLEMQDLAYLTANTGHEFAILRGKRVDVLFHGDHCRCEFPPVIAQRLLEKNLRILGHSHPGEPIPIPSPQDRMTLAKIGQTESRIISSMTGQEITFTADLFEDIL